MVPTVPLANAVFSPTDTEVAAARRVLEATANGVAVLDGQIVDAVHIRLARQIIERPTRRWRRTRRD